MTWNTTRTLIMILSLSWQMAWADNAPTPPHKIIPVTMDLTLNDILAIDAKKHDVNVEATLKMSWQLAKVNWV